MSQDLRRRIAYFGPREKVYNKDEDSEIPGLPRQWRRILCMAWPHNVAGPCGNIYTDTEHAIAAFRAHYTTNNPALANLFRPEHEAFQNFRVCRRWSTNNGLSLLMSDPDDRVWYVVRDRCMFDLIFQRVARDDMFRHIMSTLCNRDYLPVYHVRTADSTTYWGAIIDKELVQSHTLNSSNKMDLDTLANDMEQGGVTNPSFFLVGKNRLGNIMVQAYKQWVHLYCVGMSLRARVVNVSEVPRIGLTQIQQVSYDDEEEINQHGSMEDSKKKDLDEFDEIIQDLTYNQSDAQFFSQDESWAVRDEEVTTENDE